MFCVVLLTICVVAIAAIVRRRKNHFSFFKNMGIPGPEPSLIWGNIFEYESGPRSPTLSKWCKEYGDIFGMYIGDIPFLVIKDLDLLQNVFVKDFNKFTNRGITMPTDQDHPLLGNSIIHAKGSQWKKVRTYITQAFTSSKLKQMVPDISHVCDMFVEILKEQADTGREFPMLKTFRGLAMDYVGRASFGIENSFLRDLDHPFMKKAIDTLPGTMRGFFHVLSCCTQSVSLLVSPLLKLNSLLGSFTYLTFSEETAKVVALRKKNSSLRKADLLQSLIDAELSDQDEDKGNNAKKLSTEDVCINSTVLFIAGFETTAITLSYLMFNIAKYPEVQERLRDEVRSAIADSGTLDFNTTMGLKYMKQVLDETLRLYPPGVTFTTRTAAEDVEYNGLKIKAGTCVMAPTFQIHRDERYWPEPDRFDPERFSPENKATQQPMAHQPFGMGPRNCVGMRLALLESMYTAARMLLDFRIELGDSQKGQMKLGYFAMASVPGNDLWVKLHKI